MEAPEFKDFAKEMVDYIANYLENIRDRWGEIPFIAINHKLTAKEQGFCSDQEISIFDQNCRMFYKSDSIKFNFFLNFKQNILLIDSNIEHE